MTVRGVDLRHARPHDPSQVERAHTRRDSEAGECVPEVVDAAMLDPGRPDRRRPVVAAPLLTLDVAASRGRKEQGRWSTGKAALDTYFGLY